ncbi:MAG: transporter associated domain-containing protein, partial [Bacteroidota bacterium]
EEYETLAGLLINAKSDLREGDQFETAGYTFKILKMNRSMPELVEASRLNPANGE